MTRPNGVTTNYTYDNLSRLLSVLHQLSGSSIDGEVYTVDAAGNRTVKTDEYANVTSNYTYDVIYELTQVTQGSTTTESYTYDPVGNRLSSLGLSPYSVNSSNELTSTPSTSYSFDNNGNLTSETTSSGTTSYTWDFENRLTSATLPNNGGTTSFKYDPFGRRIYKSSSLGTSIYAYDGNNVIEAANSAGGLLAHYAQGQSVDQPLAIQQGSTTSFYEADGLGSITSLTALNGTLSQTYTYDSFGNATGSSGSLTNSFRYTAREFDTETGLFFLRARYYDPTIGRFLSEDPVGFPAGSNFYRYVGNGPIDFADPLGQFRTTDDIKKHMSPDIDPECGQAAGACTIIKAALVLCDCEQDCKGGWKASAELRIYGDIFAYGGPFPYKGRRPKDRSVHDGPSAIAHEYTVHIDPSIGAVAPMINGLEAKTFGSKDECMSECDKTSKAVNDLFHRTLADTQKKENEGGSFDSTQP
jgi:RHS repeat-associated protein